jgi:hypothetical protein
MTVAVRCPIIIDAYDCTAWLPNPTIFGGVYPIAIGIQIFRPPHIFVVVLNVVT